MGCVSHRPLIGRSPLRPDRLLGTGLAGSRVNAPLNLAIIKANPRILGAAIRSKSEPANSMAVGPGSYGAAHGKVDPNPALNPAC